MTGKASDPPAGESTITRIAMFSARHRRLVALSWVLLVVLAVAASIAAPANTDIEQNPPGESGTAAALYEQRFGVTEEPQEIVVFEHPTLTVDDPAYQQTVSGLMARLRSLRAVSQGSVSSLPVTESTRIVSGTITHYDTGLLPEASPFVARLASGGDVTFALVALNGDLAEAEEHVQDVIDTVSAAESQSQGFRISVGGDASITRQSEKLIEEDFAFALQLNIAVTLVILVLAFGALLAAAVPLALAFAAIITATGVLSLIS